MLEAVDVSVVIVNWNTRDELLRCIESVRAQPSVRSQVIVVDNASKDGSAEAADELEPPITLIANSGNRGLAAGNNQGIALARADAVLITNPDVIFQSESIAAMLRTMQERPRAGMVIPKLLYPDGSIQTNAGDLPSFADAYFGRRANKSPRRDPCTGYWWDRWAHDEERPIGRGGEAAYLVRRAAIDAVGNQDERFTLDWEGIDWAARFRAAGWEIWFCPNAHVVHLGERSIVQARFRWVAESHRGMFRYFAARAPRMLRPFLALAVCLRAVVKAAALAFGVSFVNHARRAREAMANSADRIQT